jgi:hypothetical protein
LQWSAAGFIVGLLFATGIILRLEMLRDRTGIEGQYAVNVQYGPWFLAAQSDLFDVTGDLPVRSNYTSGLNYGAVDFTTTYLHGAALALARITDPHAIGQLNFTVPWQSLLLVPLTVIALYARFCQLRGKNLNPVDIASLYAFAAFGHYGMINWGISGGVLVPYGWVLFLLIYLTLLMPDASKQWHVRWVALFIFFAWLAQPTYHTLALALLVGVIWLALVYLILERRMIVQSNTILLVSGMFAAFLMYHARTFFNDYGRLGRRFFEDIFRSEENQTFAYFFRLSGVLAGLQYISYIAVAVPTICFLLLWWRRRRSDVLLSYHFAWLVWLVPMSMLFFAWAGFAGVVPRVLQFGTLLSLISAALVFSMGERLLRLVTTTAVVLSTFIAVYSVPAAGIGTATLLTEDEWTAIVWYKEHVGCDHVVFTDFRIGPAFGYQGCFGVIGPTASSLTRSGQSNIVPDLFYETTATRIAAALEVFTTTNGERAEYALISATMTDPRTGVYLPDGHLRPMLQSTWSLYQKLPSWEAIYRNESVLILRRVGIEGSTKGTR